MRPVQIIEEGKLQLEGTAVYIRLLSGTFLLGRGNKEIVLLPTVSAEGSLTVSATGSVLLLLPWVLGRSGGYFLSEKSTSLLERKPIAFF